MFINLFDIKAIAHIIYLEWDHGGPAIFMVVAYVLRFMRQHNSQNFNVLGPAVPKL